MKRTIVFLFVLLLLVSTSFAQDSSLTAEQLIAKAIAAVGTQEARATMPVYQWDGKASYIGTRVAGAEGTALLLNDGNKVKFATKFDSRQYIGDQFVFDGSKVMVSKDNRGEHTTIGEFIFLQNPILSDGLFGGVMTNNWPLYDPKLRSAKVRYDGIKKIDGASYHQLTYIPKKNSGNLTVKLLFDPDTFRHVETVYEITMETGMMGQGTSMTAMSADTRRTYRMQESFSDFKQLGPLMLPTHQKITYQSTSGGVGNWVFDMSYTKLNDHPLPQ